MAHKLKIELDQSEPLIYRTVVLPEKFTFHELHQVIQIIMNFTDSHMYQFNTGRAYRGETISLQDNDNDMYFEPTIDSESTEIRHYLNDTKKKMTYIYDFGDDWIFTIKLLQKPKDEILFPTCIKGENAGPIEDCGGIHGFYTLLETLNSPENTPEKEEMREWVGLIDGMNYEDEYGFNMEDINVMLKEEFCP